MKQEKKDKRQAKKDRRREKKHAKKMRYKDAPFFVKLDSENNKISTDFDGKWVSIGGEILATEPVGETPTTISYRCPVVVNSTDSYLMISCDKKTGELSITGVQEQSDEEFKGTAY